MAATIDELTIQYEENGVVLVEELGKEVLSKGAWTTILFRARQWDARKEAFKPECFFLRRYRKIKDEYRQQSKFTISSRDQAQKLIDALAGWLEEPEG